MMSASMDDSLWCNILLLGCVDVGKSAIIRRLDQNIFIYGQGTNSLGKDFINKTLSTQSGVKVTCRIWDTADMERYSISIPSNLYRCKQGFVFVYSLTSKSSLRSLNIWMENAKSYYQGVLPPSIILANKSDDITRFDHNSDDACEIYRGFKCFETSALDNSGIDAAFSYLATEILNSEIPRVNYDHDSEIVVGPPIPVVDPPFNFIKIMKHCSVL